MQLLQPPKVDMPLRKVSRLTLPVMVRLAAVCFSKITATSRWTVSNVSNKLYESGTTVIVSGENTEITGNIQLDNWGDQGANFVSSLNFESGKLNVNIIVDTAAVEIGVFSKITISGGTFTNSAIVNASKYTVYGEKNILAVEGWNIINAETGTWYNR